LKKVDDRERVLSEEEIKSVWAAAGNIGAPYVCVVRLLILTGQRLTEIADLRWSEVNFSKKQLELPGSRTKNKRPHIVALCPAAVEILETAKENKIKSDEGLVFTIGGDRLNGWSKLRGRLYKAVEMPGLSRSSTRWMPNMMPLRPISAVRRMPAGPSSRPAMTMAVSPADRPTAPPCSSLLADVRARKINVIVVYKVDRLGCCSPRPVDGSLACADISRPAGCRESSRPRCTRQRSGALN
jgi:hypothetical protein